MRRPLIVFLESYVAGGADQVVVSISSHLVEHRTIELFVNARFDPAVLLAQPWPESVHFNYYSWSTVAEWANWSRRGKSTGTRCWRRFVTLLLRYPWLMLQTVLFFFRFRSLRPSAVWVNNGGYPGGDACRAATIAAGWLNDCRVLHVVHSMAQSPRRLLKPMEWLLDRLLDRSATIVAVSNAVAKSITSVRAIRQTPVVVYNGLEDRPPPPPVSVGETLRLLQVGYLDRNKNQALSIQALGILKKEGISSIELFLVGKEVEPGYRAELEALADALGVSEQVQFVGFIKNMEPYYARCDALVLTSLVEGLPLCVIEAMRAGRSVVATRAGGVAELVIEGETGRLLSNYLPEELALVFRNWLERKEVLFRFGLAARQRYIEKFQLSNQVSLYANLLGISEKSEIGGD